MSWWQLPPDLLDAVIGAAGVSLDAPPLETVNALRAWLPMGSTGKLDAIARDERPPGLDPAAVASVRLSGWTTSWSCWASGTLMAAVLAAGGHRARLLALHRRDAEAISFDLHSALVIDEELVVDPYLGAFAGVPFPTGGTVADAAAALTVSVEGGRVVQVDVLPPGGNPLEYRVVVDDVDPALLAGILDVSKTHSGVPFERSTQWAGDGELVRISEREGVGRWRRFTGGRGGPAPLVEERWGPYDDLVDDLATHARWR